MICECCDRDGDLAIYETDDDDVVVLCRQCVADFNEMTAGTEMSGTYPSGTESPR